MKNTYVIFGFFLMMTGQLFSSPKYGNFKTIEYTDSGKVYKYYDPKEIDYRDISTGTIIRDKGYSDQPYVVIADDGAWVLVLTTCGTREGASGQHIVSYRSLDKGKTWTDHSAIEPPDGPPASWGMPYKTPYGRIYVFYTYNTDNIKQVISDKGLISRVDTLGDMMFKYSDDHGKTWSRERYKVPIRRFKIDRENPYQGKLMFWWGVGKPITQRGKMYLGFSKIAGFDLTRGFMTRDEGAFICSDNILTEKDPERLNWQTLPEGDIGLRAAKGDIADEHNLVPLDDGSLFCVFRTVNGYAAQAYSRDGGRTWIPPANMKYKPGGRDVKNPRANNCVKKFSNGKYLYWYHNNSLGEYSFSAKKLGNNRNPGWICGGVEKDGYIHWSEPEILLYALDATEAISYPDFIEDGGEYYITETQKTIARLHKIDNELLEGLWNQHMIRSKATKGLVLELSDCKDKNVSMPGLPSLDLREIHRRPAPPHKDCRGGFTIEMWVQFDKLQANQVLFDSRNKAGRGILITTTDLETVEIRMDDSRCKFAWDCDQGLLSKNKLHHIVFIVDGGPKVVSIVVDGMLCDGGKYRDFGWGRFYELRDVNGSDRLRIAPSLKGEMKTIRIYDRYLRTSEAIGNYRIGL